MRKRRKKIAAALVLCVSLLSSPSVLAAAITTNSIAGWPQGPEIVDETGVLMEAETGTILYDKGMDQRMYPASTTKIMTALVVLENTERSPDQNHLHGDRHQRSDSRQRQYPRRSWGRS